MLCREHVNVVFIGHVDAGKSTIGGQILFLTGGVDERTIQKYERCPSLALLSVTEPVQSCLQQPSAEACMLVSPDETVSDAAVVICLTPCA